MERKAEINKIDPSFSVSTSSMVKGAAIFLMVGWHLFHTNPQLLEQYHVCNFFLPMQYTELFGSFGGICVSLFVFITGFGTARQFRNRKIVEGKAYFLERLKRYIRLALNYFFVYLAVVSTSFLGRDLTKVYGAGINKWAYAAINAIGFQWILDTPSLNDAWWYMYVAVLLLFAAPALLVLYRKSSGVVIVSIVLPYLLSLDDPFMNYVSVLMIGIVFAERDLFEKAQQWKWAGHAFFSEILKFVLCTFAILFGCYLSMIDTKYRYTMFCIIVPGVSYIIYRFSLIWKGGGIRLLAIFGQHSMNIWLVHTMLYKYYFQKLFYALRYAALIYAAVLFSSLLVSVVIEKLKKCLGYNRLIDGLCGSNV